MEISVELSRKDYSSYLKYYFFRKVMKGRLMFIIAMVLILPILFTVGKPFKISDFLTDIISTLISVIFILLLLGIIFSLFIKFMPMKDVLKMGKRKYNISEEGIAIETENSSIFQKWSGIKNVEQNKYLILIFIDKVGAHIIPKRYFESQTILNSFVDMIKGKINPK